MGAYNEITADMSCPRCGKRAEFEVELHFGDTRHMSRLALGEVYPWRERGCVVEGGRPPGGNCEGKGYTECPHCGKDFFVKVLVSGDVLEACRWMNPSGHISSKAGAPIRHGCALGSACHAGRRDPAYFMP